MKNLLTDLDETTGALMQAIHQFSDEQLNRVPYEGSWTAGQVAEHIVKFSSGTPRLLSGTSKQTDRGADEKVELIESIFLDFNTKMTSPDFIEPTAGHKVKTELLITLGTAFAEIRKAATTEDLSLIFNDFSIPHMGEFTGVEWVAFIIAHTKRHIYQLNKIFQTLKDHTATS